MRRADAVAAVLLLAVAAVYFQQSFLIVRGFATDRLGPAFVPRVLAGALALLSLTLLARALAGRSDPTPPPPARTALLATTLVLLTAYGAILPRLGFLLATPLLMAATLRVLGVRRPLPVVAAATGITAALYVVFGRLLGVLLPPGPLGRL